MASWIFTTPVIREAPFASRQVKDGLLKEAHVILKLPQAHIAVAAEQRSHTLPT